ncbi:MAG TPA: glutamate-cysteine ligase family protein, partial [Candidatus Deferrimicrobium sp.]|nr:glutamate-cysteine ligase family protein [Candidatus Deferrimicrobium sp.]
MSVIEKKEELEAYFHDAGKTREHWRVGTEYEKVGIDRVTGKAIPYSGPRGVNRILRELSDRFGWAPEEQDGNIIALSRDKAQITLEPGGQIELSGEPCDSIHCTYGEFTQHIRELLEVSEPLDVVFLGLGMQPVRRIEEIEWGPKKRYRIMGPYMPKVGTLGQRMMKQTATVQTNIDFLDEKDAMLKFRTGMGLAPILIAMFANSPICDGQLNGYRSFREHIWTDTDRSRSGLLKFAFSSDASFAHYVEYALDVPMYFIIRHHDYIDMTSMTFRQFLQFGHNGERATMEDWADHLTTLFPETRIKRYIEIRSVDSQPPELMPALSALTKGVFYDDDCLHAAWDLVKGWTWDERMETYLDSHKNALAARFRRHTLFDLAKELFEIG